MALTGITATKTQADADGFCHLSDGSDGKPKRRTIAPYPRKLRMLLSRVLKVERGFALLSELESSRNPTVAVPQPVIGTIGQPRVFALDGIRNVGKSHVVLAQLSPVSCLTRRQAQRFLVEKPSFLATTCAAPTMLGKSSSNQPEPCSITPPAR
jgi:hypothetical protein